MLGEQRCGDTVFFPDSSQQWADPWQAVLPCAALCETDGCHDVISDAIGDAIGTTYCEPQMAVCCGTVDEYSLMGGMDAYDTLSTRVFDSNEVGGQSPSLALHDEEHVERSLCDEAECSESRDRPEWTLRKPVKVWGSQTVESVMQEALPALASLRVGEQIFSSAQSGASCSKLNLLTQQGAPAASMVLYEHQGGVAASFHRRRGLGSAMVYQQLQAAALACL